MSVSTLLDSNILRSLIGEMTQKAFQQFAAWLPAHQPDLPRIVPALLVAQLTLQAALQQVPRERVVLDGSTLQAVGSLARKIISELIENEKSQPNEATSVAKLMRGSTDQTATIWELEFILSSTGFENDDATLAIPKVVIWVRQQSKLLALSMLKQLHRLPAKSENQELDFHGGETSPKATTREPELASPATEPAAAPTPVGRSNSPRCGRVKIPHPDERAMMQ
jgi:hypothetical protein